MSIFDATYDALFGSGGMEDAEKYLGQIEQMMKEMYGPYRESGMRAMSELEEQYMQLLNSPEAVNAMLSSGFQASPGYEYQVQQGMNATNQAAAAGGMLGTPSHQQQAASMNQNIANQDYYQYMNQMTGLYNQGLSQANNMNQMGFNATNQMAQGMQGVGQSMASLGYASQQNQSNALMELLGLGAGIGMSALGMPGGMTISDMIGGTSGITTGNPNSPDYLRYILGH